MFAGDLERAAIARGQETILAMAAAAPDRADGMNDKTRGQFVATGDFGIARDAAAKFAAFGQEFRPRRAMNCAVHAASTKKRGVGGIDDRINTKPSDILDDDFEHKRPASAKG